MTPAVATIVVALALDILGGPLGAEAQSPAKVPRMGILRTSPEPPAWGFFFDALRELGYVEGRTITIERR